MYRESHPRARKGTHIPERIGLCGPLSGCELYHHVALHHSLMRTECQSKYIEKKMSILLFVFKLLFSYLDTLPELYVYGLE